MELNGTLWVQMVHFVLACIIFDRLFLRMVIAQIRAEDKTQQAFDQEIAEQSSRIAERIRHNEQDWSLLQKRLRAECPHPDIGAKMPAVIESAEALDVGFMLGDGELRAQVQKVLLERVKG